MSVQIIAQQHFQRMWELLRAIVLALMRPGPQLTTAAGRKQLQDDLMEYGALAEEYLGARACKYSLHLLACRYAHALHCKHARPVAKHNSQVLTLAALMVCVHVVCLVCMHALVPSSLSQYMSGMHNSC